MSRWKRAHHRAAINWITKYRSTQNSSNIVKVKGRLEAFYHYCQTEEWIAATSIWGLTISKSSDVAFERQLQMWGYYEQSLTINKALLGKFSTDMDCMLLRIISRIYMQIGQYQEDLATSLQVLDICKNNSDRSGIASSLLSIGTAYYALGNTGGN
jgi:tetratricopeptide (TPR) repeat protein